MRFLYFINILLLFIPFISYSQNSAAIFAPDSIKRTIEATEIPSNLRIDGKLEEEWKLAKPATQFFQVEPYQGKTLNFDTEIRVLYNKQFLYISAFNKDSLGKKSLRVPDFRRDFSSRSHDHFGFSIDGFNDKRNAMVMVTNPYSTQRDLLTFDDVLFDLDWDGLWRVRTHRTDSGWVAEFAIPWQTLRYPRTDSTNQSWGINFFRNRRYSNEYSSWNPFPRAFSPSRMDYAGTLIGIKPPPPSPNIRIQPYLLVSTKNSNGSEIGDHTSTEVKPGGEIKWAINPNTVLDMTFNTDFAQADVDRQVNNITRFGIFFPERRQFFLENASLFGVGLAPNDDLSGGSMRIQPFFSRRIGLDDSGNPIPIDAGARMVYRSLKRNAGGIVMRQRGTDGSPLTHYAVGRYVENIGKQNRLGGLFTMKQVESLHDTIKGYTHWVGAADGFFRINESASFNFMVMGSASGRPNDQGFAAYAQYFRRTNRLISWWTQSIVTQNFNPEVGFVSRNDVIATTPGFFFLDRGAWMPKWLRGFEPGLMIEMYHRATTGELIEFQFNSNPIWLNLQNGGFFGILINPTFQRLGDMDERPLDITIKNGVYKYVRSSFYSSSDPSRKFTVQLNGETGGYYGGKLHFLEFFSRYSPLPHLAFTFRYQANFFRNVGSENFSDDVQLYTIDGRVALNPRLQLIGFYQKNTLGNRDTWNVRLSWEFKPLSFLFLVYNNRAYTGTKNPVERQYEQNVIGKITFLKQF
ncbi:carbohydrate binding family 9 domain-containing protein [Xanthocytophaga agilis]|uniref:DUF5916 domain-containing protein n=1 Tax=Xanthocytophaga agilis TaxID=3048010 RepID=A0AAE3R5G1_9BACT|nr:DUF5916 domain-containing protein [Xanthocytophaga agilis]MDJ1504134.1 DUF5916 domain-containing protein [Xanthocytophaga agilis]